MLCRVDDNSHILNDYYPSLSFAKNKLNNEKGKSYCFYANNLNNINILIKLSEQHFSIFSISINNIHEGLIGVVGFNKYGCTNNIEQFNQIVAKIIKDLKRY